MNDNLPKKSKLLVLAIDAGDKVLIRDWAADGTLPAINALMQKGLVGDTLSVPGLTEGATWPSFYTGVNPGRHGFHRLYQLAPGTYTLTHRRPGEFISDEPFWTALSRHGRRVAVLDVPLSGLARHLNGLQTVEWASHDGVYGFQTHPRGLERDILARFGRHPVAAQCDADRRSAEDFIRFRDELVAGARLKGALTRHYLHNERWDFFIQVFTEAHCAGHQCWHLHDPQHPNHDPALAARTGDVVRDVYRAIDGEIGRILAGVDGDTTVFLIATHRMAHNVGANFLLEEILARLGYLRRLDGGGAAGPSPAAPGGPAAFARAQWARLPAGARKVFKPLLRSLAQGAGAGMGAAGARPVAPSVDFSASQCFPHPNGYLVSGIRVNQHGREPQGMVAPGREKEELCERIAADLLALVEKESGRPMVRRVLRTAEFYHGEKLDHLPDILVEWNDEVRVASRALGGGGNASLRLTSPRTGTVEASYTYGRSGDHRPEGLFIAAGPGLAPGRLERTVSIMDFAPTFLSLLGVEPRGLDGRVIEKR